MQPDLIRAPLRCRWGLHKWGKWFVTGTTGRGWYVQHRDCLSCNKRQSRIV